MAGTHERIETFSYDPHGKLGAKSGAGGYPVTYTYDAVGNQLTLTDGNNHTTRWTYTTLNQVDTKTYADGTSQSYTYDIAGRLMTRRDALNRTTSYSYNAYDLPTSVDYPTNPDIAFTYDQQGRRLSMTDGSGTTSWTYDAAGRPLAETQGHSHHTLTFSYDAQSLRTGTMITSSDSGVVPWLTGYTYDNAGRLRTVLDDRLSAAAPYTYAYAPNANLVASITTPTGLKTLKTYDNLGRLLTTAGQTAAAAPINSFVYTYDAAGQRNTETATTGKRDFTYDAWRQLTLSVKTVNSTETDRHSYNFDSIGNRLEVGRVVPNAPSETTTYTANPVNQYSAITGTQADTPTYDANGNTLTVGRVVSNAPSENLTLTYDEENRLIEAASATQRSVYVYDGFGRRVGTREYSGTAPTNWTLQNTRRFVYEGWRVMEELDAAYVTVRSYTRGLDLSGSSEGAGGIGGQLAMTTGGATASSRTTASYFYDGNGNVTDLAFDDGAVAAHYEYSPFGERLVATGTWADTNPYQFSSKERDSFTGFYYYGLRYYSPGTGRFLGRDPVFEEGGLNLYAFVENGPISEVDLLGLACVNFSTSINIDLNSGKLSPTVHFPNGSQIDVDVSGSVRIMLSGKKCDVCCGGDNSKAYAYTASASITGDLTVDAFAGWKLNESYGGGASVDVWAGVKGSAGSHIDLSDNYSWGGCAGSKFDVHIKTSTSVELKGGGQAKWKWKNGASHSVGEATATGKLEGFEKYITLTECDETGCHGKIKMSNGDVGKFSGNVKFCAAGFGCVERSWSQ